MADILESEPMRKLFIGGVDRSTTDGDFAAHFGQYGTILDSVLIKDKEDPTKHRGFGFVTYDTSDSVEEVFNARPHDVGGKKLDVKRAMPKDSSDPNIHLKTNKLFIGGLAPGVGEDEIRSYLGSRHPPSKCGEITKVDIIKDKETGTGKGYGFIECGSTDLADRIAICEAKFSLNGKAGNIKKAGEKGGDQGGRGGRGGGRGAGRGGRGGRGGGNFNQGGGNFNSTGYPNQSNWAGSYGGGYSAGGYGQATGQQQYDNYPQQGFNQAGTYNQQQQGWGQQNNSRY